LPWPPKGENPKPLVAAAFDAIARVCDSMVVVVGHESKAVIDALSDRKFESVEAGNGQAEMMSSVRSGFGLPYLRDATISQFLLHPADHPSVRLDTLQALIRQAENAPHCAVMPQYRGKGGHPALIPRNVVDAILSTQGQGGLRQFWVDRPELCVRLPVDDPGVVFDIDTQSDYDFSVG
jgi:molybdenum cofactor cytidylyltransferase